MMAYGVAYWRGKPWPFVLTSAKVESTLIDMDMDIIDMDIVEEIDNDDAEPASLPQLLSESDACSTRRRLGAES